LHLLLRVVISIVSTLGWLIGTLCHGYFRYLPGTKGNGLVYRRQPRHVELGCYAERVPDYQLDPQYLLKGGNRTSEGSLHIYAHILIRIMLETWIQGGQLQHYAIFGNGKLLLGNQRCNLQ